MSASIRIEGLEKTLARFDVKKYEPQVQQCFDRFGQNVKELANQKIADNKTTDRGLLTLRVFADVIPLGSAVGDSANYASFIEFGTRKYAAEYVAQLPAEWQKLAAKSKGGGGGTFRELVINLTGWVHRKGITGTYSVKTRKRTGGEVLVEAQDKQAAYAIALKILRDGIPAQPYLYPSVNTASIKLLKELNEIKL